MGVRRVSDENITDIDDARRRRFEAGLEIADEVSIRREIRRLRPGDPFMECKPGAWKALADEYGLPPHCPVIPLGRDGDTCFVLNTFGTVSTLTANNSKKGQIQFIFGNLTCYAVWAWPRWNAKAEKFEDNFNADAAARSLIEACTEKSERHGAWDMVDKVRGRGLWVGEDNRLIAHLGDCVLVGGVEARKPSEIGGYLYPKRPSIKPPAKVKPKGGDGGPGHELLGMLQTWNWSRPEVDPILLLGWMGQGYLSGALKWRSVAYITGGFGTGKSTLLDLINNTLGGLAIKAEDATAPSIYRMLNNDASAVILDENEASEDDRKERGLLKLAREAASGSLVVRANQSGGASEFRARSSFLFASINPPGLQPQDYSRMAILNLRPIEKLMARAEWANADALAEIGRDILRRLIDDYHRIIGLIEIFRAALVTGGHSGRGGDTFGTLAAISHAILYDDDPDYAQLDEWARLLAPHSLAELELATDGWTDCLDQLLNAQPDALRNTPHKSVGAMLADYRDQKIEPHLYDGGAESVDTRMRKMLASVGLGLIQPKSGAMGFETAELFVPASHPATSALFAGSIWHGRGVYISSLRQAPRGMWRTVKGNVGIQKKSGIAINLNLLTERTEDDDCE